MCMDDSKKIQKHRCYQVQMVKKFLKYLFTWADGLVGKAGYVYQAFNFLYGGYIWTDTLQKKVKKYILEQCKVKYQILKIEK